MQTRPGLSEELEGIDELSLAVFRAFMRTLRLHARLMVRTTGEHGAHPGQAICLRALARRDGITQRDLADELDLARPTVSKMLAGMERSGLVERETDASDQRLTRVRLSPKGRALAQALRVVAADHIRETIGGLPEADRAELARLLDALSDKLSQALAARSGDGGSEPTLAGQDQGEATT